MNHHLHIEQLIIKYLSDEANLDEKKELKQLLEKDATVRQQFIELRDIWNYSNTNEFDAKQAFTRFKLRIRTNDTRKLPIVPYWLKYASIAASIIVVFLVGYSIYSVVDESETVYYSYSTEAGERKEITLGDSTKIWLNGETTLVYSSEYNDSGREVQLSGEAFFDVMHNKHLPFKVKSGNHSITVLGTRFNLRTNDKTIETVLAEGKVRIDVGKRLRCQLLPGQKSLYDIKSNQLLKLEVPNVDQYTAITNGQLIFKNETLSDLKPRLESWYGVDINLHDNVKELRFTGTVERESLEDILNIMGMSNNIKYTKVNDTITITGN